MENTTALDALFAEYDHTRRSIAEIVGVTVQAVMLWAHGTRKITAETALLIEAKAGIPRSKLRSDLWPSDAARKATRATKSQTAPKATQNGVGTGIETVTQTVPVATTRKRRAALQSTG